MKSAIMAFAAVVLLSSVGCHHNLCQQCDSCSGRATPVAQLPQDAGPYGPPAASYGYPYYTTRAPRDFLQNNPMGIGP
jgi:hypothetical protein